MPRATVSEEDRVRKDLKSLEGAFVVLRPLTFGEFATRREMMTKMTMRGSKEDAAGEINAMNRAVTEYEFRKTIIEHNLEDSNGVLLNFKNPASFDLLISRVGEEIGTYIEEMNNFDEDLKKSKETSVELSNLVESTPTKSVS